MVEIWVTVLCSIGGAVIGAIISGFFSILIERRNQKKQEEARKKAELQKQIENRPRLELKKYYDIKHATFLLRRDFECLLLKIQSVTKDNHALQFLYNDKALNKKNLSCVEYVFTNTGKTEIDSVCIVTNQPTITSIIELENREVLINEKFVSYEAWSNKRFIKPNESISIRICFVKGEEMASPISALTTIYLQDINGRIWRQPLFCPTNEIENSTLTSHTEFKNVRDVEQVFDI